jgi:hypothetical protein
MMILLQYINSALTVMFVIHIVAGHVVSERTNITLYMK